jgi:hypothetical protein
VAGGKESYASLRDLYRAASFRRFSARHRNNRRATFLGFAPGGAVLGWWDNTTDVIEFAPDEAQWTDLVTYA